MLSTPSKPTIIVICGPTASGKTAAAINLARAFRGEIIGADSMQIYRYMDIGTAKPTIDEQTRVPHHMIDIINPDEHFDAKTYAHMARAKIMELFSQGMNPFVVGGTGFYIKALVHGLFAARPSDPDLRERLHREADSLGTDFLHQRLSRVDPKTAQRIHPNDTYRIIRALETYELTGKRLSEHHHAHGFMDNRFKVLKLGLLMDREQLYDRINRRVDDMITAGFVTEVQKLLNQGYAPDLKSMQSIGYRHLVDFIQGRHSWDETRHTLKRDTRRYAKRQLTWFKADPEINWYHPEHLGDMHRVIKHFLLENSF
ncbi:MAG: tRNA (adenosine(37)-N6)-dimethylallyltransferase MiaA [Proteobacteria bacterium]|nr:tRNA (adenosine(37)-N6)-dimethylallyltransferase MiaA [Pseudomonadota bacterium]